MQRQGSIEDKTYIANLVQEEKEELTVQKNLQEDPKEVRHIQTS
jgi:hypothetical protein